MPQRTERTVSLDDDLTDAIDRRNALLYAQGDVEEELNRSDVINAILRAIVRPATLTDADRELLEAHGDVAAVVGRTADSKGRVRLGGAEYGGREFLVVAIEETDDAP